MVQWSTWHEAETPASLYDEQVTFFDTLARALEPMHAPNEVDPDRYWFWAILLVNC